MCQVIAEIRRRGSLIGLYLNGDTVIFRCNFEASDPDYKDFDIFEEVEFEIDDYRKGIEELREKGECAIKGDGRDLSIKMANKIMALEIKGMNASDFYTDWDIESISV